MRRLWSRPVRDEGVGGGRGPWIWQVRLARRTQGRRSEWPRGERWKAPAPAGLWARARPRRRPQWLRSPGRGRRSSPISEGSSCGRLRLNGVPFQSAPCFRSSRRMPGSRCTPGFPLNFWLHHDRVLDLDPGIRRDERGFGRKARGYRSNAASPLRIASACGVCLAPERSWRIRPGRRRKGARPVRMAWTRTRLAG